MDHIVTSLWDVHGGRTGNETGSGWDAKYMYVRISKVVLNHTRGDGNNVTSCADEAHRPICANLRV